MRSHLKPSTPTPNLIEFDQLKQRLEIAFAKALMAFAQDDLEEDRAEQILREDLR